MYEYRTVEAMGFAALCSHLRADKNHSVLINERLDRDNDDIVRIVSAKAVIGDNHYTVETHWKWDQKSNTEFPTVVIDGDKTLIELLKESGENFFLPHIEKYEPYKRVKR